MVQEPKRDFKVLSGGQNELEALHDEIINMLDSHEKRGIRQLLYKNNESFKKLIFPYFQSHTDQSALMTALAGILEVHARECYAIGYLDCVINQKFKKPNSSRPVD